MNFAQAFTYVFEDPDWAKKVLIPALIGIIPIIGQIFLVGWALDITRRVIQRNPRPLPELDFGRQLGDGLRGFVIGLVYALPIIILVIPIIVVSTSVNSQLSDPNPNLTPLVGFVSVCCGGLILLYAIFMAFVLPAAMGNYAAKGNLGAGFNFREIFGLLRAAPGAYLLTPLGVIIAGLISGIGSIACFIGVVVTLAYAQAVMGHLYGQAYLEGSGNRGFAQVY